MNNKKIITRIFKKYECTDRHPNNRHKMPTRNEVINWIQHMNKKGYCVKSDSISFDNISLPYEYPYWALWGWFIYVGKQKAQEQMNGVIVNEEKNKAEFTIFYGFRTINIIRKNKEGIREEVIEVTKKADIYDFLSDISKELIKNTNW